MVRSACSSLCLLSVLAVLIRFREGGTGREGPQALASGLGKERQGGQEEMGRSCRRAPSSRDPRSPGSGGAAAQDLVAVWGTGPLRDVSFLGHL